MSFWYKIISISKSVAIFEINSEKIFHSDLCGIINDVSKKKKSPSTFCILK